MVSRNALEDLETFLISPSDWRSGAGLSDAAEDIFETVDDEGDVGFDDKLDCCCVLFIKRDCCGGLVSDSEGAFEVLFKAGRPFDALVSVFLSPPYTPVLEGRGSARLEGVTVLDDSTFGPELIRGVGFFSLEGPLVDVSDLCSADVPFEVEDDVADMRDLDGRRVVGGGWERKSVPLCCREDGLDGDLEWLVNADDGRDGERIGLAGLKKLDRFLRDTGDGGICDRVSMVRSDKEVRVIRARPRASAP